MAEMKRFQLDLTEQEHKEMEKLMGHAGLKTKREFVTNALTLFRWAANELVHGRIICSMWPDKEEIKQLEMPSLQAFTRIFEEIERKTPSPEELFKRSQRPGIPADQVIAEMRKLLEEFDEQNSPIQPRSESQPSELV